MAPHRSYWLQDVSLDSDDGASLAGSTTADVAIIGGGYVGLWTALRLKEIDSTLDVAVIERDLCGAGASGRNGGEILSWWAKFTKLLELCGADEAVRLALASEAAAGKIKAFCDENGIDADFRSDGFLWTATTGAQLGAWDSTIESIEAAGYCRFEALDADEVARVTGSPVHLAGVFDRTGATVHPAKLVRGLRRVALERGVRIYEKTEVQSIGRSRPSVLETPAGRIVADRVVIAMNAWAAAIRELRSSIVVVSSDIVLTPRMPRELDTLGWRGHEAISDSQLMVNYYRRTDDGRAMFGKGGLGVAFGGRVGPGQDRSQSRAEVVQRSLGRIYPALASAPIEHHWSGPVDRSYDGMPLFGHLGDKDHICYGIGWSGNGVGPSLVGAEILASLALGTDDEWATSRLAIAPRRRLPPEPIRWVGAHIVQRAVSRSEERQVANKEPHAIDRFLAGLAPQGIVPDKR